MFNFIRFFLISLCLALIFSACTPPLTTDSTTTESSKTMSDEKTVIKIPDNEEECLAKGGTWKARGIFPNEICDLPTTDGGKECSSSNDCEGRCLAADLTEDQRRALMGGEKFDAKVRGECTYSLRTFGCVGFVEGGKVDQFLCLD